MSNIPDNPLHIIEETTETQNSIVEIFNALRDLVLEKNKRYGDSALKPKNVFSKLNAGEAIKVRLDDKLSRVMNSGELRTNDVSDLIGYLTLYLISQNTTRQDIIKEID